MIYLWYDCYCVYNLCCHLKSFSFLFTTSVDSVCSLARIYQINSLFLVIISVELFVCSDFSKCGIQYFQPLIQTYSSNLVNVVIIFFINEPNEMNCLIEQLINVAYATIVMVVVVTAFYMSFSVVRCRCNFIKWSLNEAAFNLVCSSACLYNRMPWAVQPPIKL